MLKDYFDGQLRKLVPVWRKSRQGKIEFGFDMMDVPGVERKNIRTSGTCVRGW